MVVSMPKTIESPSLPNMDEATLTEPVVKEPDFYRVVMLNDDYTHMDFVVYVLKQVFHKNDYEANALMQIIHQKGRGVAGVYTYEVAESKASEVVVLARENEYPLQCTLEKDREKSV